MAQVIHTRTAVQCRSHHQKMLKNLYVQDIMAVGVWMNLMQAMQMQVKMEQQDQTCPVSQNADMIDAVKA